MNRLDNSALVALYAHEPEMRRLCDVDNLGECVCHMIYTKAWTHGESLTIGGFAAGQESHVMALVEDSSGHMHEVMHQQVRFLDRCGR